MQEHNYVKAPGVDGWNDDMTKAESMHLLGRAPEATVIEIGSTAVGKTYFESQCPVNPTPEQTAHMLRNQLNPEAGAAVLKFQSKLEEV